MCMVFVGWDGKIPERAGVKWKLLVSGDRVLKLNELLVLIFLLENMKILLKKKFSDIITFIWIFIALYAYF